MKVNGIELVMGMVYYANGKCVRHNKRCVHQGIMDYIGSSTFTLAGNDSDTNYHQYSFIALDEFKEIKGNNKNYLAFLKKSEEEV